MKRFGLVGARLGHSLSPVIHKLILKELGIAGTYDLIEVSQSNLNEKIRECQGKYDGLNVTIPHKINVMASLTTLSKAAQAIGAVNTIYFTKGAIRGENTDYMGFGQLLNQNSICLQGKTVAVLGTGGASRAIIQYLVDHDVAKLFIVSRDSQNIAPYMKVLCSSVPTQFINYSHIEDCAGDVLINCTPVGMHPEIEESPVPIKTIEHFEAVVDLIYNPLETVLLRQAKELGKKTANGMIMLVAQAVASEEIWLQQKISQEITSKVAAKLAKEI